MAAVARRQRRFVIKRVRFSLILGAGADALKRGGLPIAYYGCLAA